MEKYTPLRRNYWNRDWALENMVGIQTNIVPRLFPSEARPKAERSGELDWSKKKWTKKKGTTTTTTTNFVPGQTFYLFFLNFHTYVPSIHSKKYLWSLLRTNSLQKTSWRNLLWEKKFFWRKTRIFRKKIFRKKKIQKYFFRKKNSKLFFFRKNIFEFFFFFRKDVFWL